MMGLYTSSTRIFMTNSSGILSHFAGMCLFSVTVEVGSVALPGLEVTVGCCTHELSVSAMSLLGWARH